MRSGPSGRSGCLGLHTDTHGELGHVADIVVALDVGGTNTRARIARHTDGAPNVAVQDDMVVQITSATALYDFVADVARTAGDHGTLTAAVTAVAGPVVNGRAEMTNWPSGAAIEVAGLERAGLPPGHTVLLNDVVAGAWGAFDRLESGTAITLTQPSPAPDKQTSGGLGDGNLVYVAPGTGLGAAALVRYGMGPHGATAVACETQHTQLPRFPGEIAEVTERIQRALGHSPSWEELVSGRGLAHTYDALCAIAATKPIAVGADDARRAGAIAAAAMTGDDAQARAAIDVFYDVLGRFAQVLALTFLPCTAVVLGGSSTERNLEIVRRSPLAQTFAEHPRLSGLLAGIPLHAVGGAVNLEGGIRLAASRPTRRC